jgi:hypothetical protein
VFVYSDAFAIDIPQQIINTTGFVAVDDLGVLLSLLHPSVLCRMFRQPELPVVYGTFYQSRLLDEANT